jgi:hypothetical protein
MMKTMSPSAVATAKGPRITDQLDSLIGSEDTPTTAAAQAIARAFHPLADLFPLIEGCEPLIEGCERMYPDLPRIELFSRSPREGWTARANQSQRATDPFEIPPMLDRTRGPR